MNVEFKKVYPGKYDKAEHELLKMTLEYFSGSPEELAAKVKDQAAGKRLPYTYRKLIRIFINKYGEKQAN